MYWDHTISIKFGLSPVGIFFKDLVFGPIMGFGVRIYLELSLLGLQVKEQ